MSRATQAVAALIILFGVISLFFLCLDSFATMKMGEMGPMANCALAHAATLCPVTVTQHLQFWQQVFVTTSPTAMLLALVLTLAAFSLRQVIDSLHAAATRLRYNVRQMLGEPTLLLGDYLKQAFAQGILHPKIY